MDVHHRDTLQEFNPEVYQVILGFCIEKFEPNFSTLLDELKRVCHLTLVQINIFCKFKSSYDCNKFLTKFQVSLPSVQITLPINSVFGNLHYIVTIPENILIEGTNQVNLYHSDIISIIVKSISEVP